MTIYPTPETSRTAVAAALDGLAEPDGRTDAPRPDHRSGSGPDVATRAGSTGMSGTALLNVMAIPLGLAGFGGVWQALRGTVDAPAWPAEVLFGVSTALWIVLSVTYVVRGLRRSGSFAEDRQDALYGPFAAYIPIIGILVASHYEQYIHDTGRAAVLVFVIALGILLAQMLAHWLLGNLPLASLHPGYLLPTVAGPFIASVGLGFCGWRNAAEGAFGIGIFLWFIFGAMIFSRLFTGKQLPDPLKPLLSVLVSAPAVGGIAWFILAGGRMDTVGYLLLGVTFMMLLVQVVIFSGYRRLRFTPTFWAFMFPVGASTNLIIRWVAFEDFPGWQAWAWTLSGIATASLLVIAAATAANAVATHRPTSAPTLS
jgi:tellurite resistance protein